MNTPYNDINRQHDQAHLDAQVLRSQALADMWAGMSQHLAELGHLAQQGAHRLAARLSRSGRSSASPLSRS